MFVMFPIELLGTTLLLYAIRANHVPCDKTRIILSQASGTITHGPPGTNYSQNTHCEWLIKGNFIGYILYNNVIIRARMFMKLHIFILVILFSAN